MLSWAHTFITTHDDFKVKKKARKIQENQGFSALVMAEINRHVKINDC